MTDFKKHRTWILTAAVTLAVIAAHFFAAPATVLLREQLNLKINEWKGIKQADAYVAELQSQPGKCRDDLVPCATAFREFLANRNIRLHIILRPSVDDLITPTRLLRTKPTEAALALEEAERKLKEAGIHTVNLLPDMYREATLHPTRPVLHPDMSHLSDDMVLVMSRTFCDALEAPQKMSDGSNILLIGDCYAFLTTTRLKQRHILIQSRSRWKSNSDSHMVYEFSRIPPELLPGVRELYWFLSSSCVKFGSAAPLPFPSPYEPSEIVPTNTRVVAAEITRLSHIPAGLDADAPYSHALAMHECITPDGERFLAVVPVMQDRRLLPARDWAIGEKVLLSLQRWDSATRAMPGLVREQIFDDLEDLAMYRYYVTGWNFPPQVQSARTAEVAPR